ncbi:MutS 4 [Mycena venus]|uniref:MutS 4 n=1 Tax=Mycena venus TaxID=2733690 RepID=A0A8H6XQJ0_9AGAR|nr:MutS 4 [Mycena venus]
MQSRPSSNRSGLRGTLRPYSRPLTHRTTAQSRPDIFRPTTGIGQSRLSTGAQTRPGTTRPTTAASAQQDCTYVIALLEGKGVAREVGMAALDRDTGRVMLVQLSDCPTYVKTLHQMHLHPPALVLVPDTSLSTSDTSSPSVLVEYIYEEFPGVPVQPIGKKYWDKTGGLQFVSQLCVEDDERAGTLLTVTNKYYALSAVCALFKHAETKLNTRFASGSLRIRYVTVEGTMMIDADSARNLELVGNMSYKRSTHSLFGTLNHTYTAMAARLLRVNILSPITTENMINARLDVVEGKHCNLTLIQLVNSETRFIDVRAGLKALNKMDFDRLIACLVSSDIEPTNAAKFAAARVSQMLDLRNVVQTLPVLRNALEGSQSQLLKVIYKMLSDERLAKIARIVCEHLNEDTARAKGGIAAINARVYAIKANCHPLLDVARETYKENIGDIFEMNRTLSGAHGLPLSLVYQETGFVFTLRQNEFEGELPPGFISAKLKRGKWVFTSMDLKKMNARMEDALNETLILSEKIIQDLVAQILADVGALYKASEAVALLDMLLSFAHTSLMHNYVRPEFTGTLAIKSGRHPILETIESVGTLVPNDVYCDGSSSFQIIQGPNMSGKSTYLRQIGLLTIIAIIHDALLTRLSNDDDMEKNLSTFASEMATSAMILGNVLEPPFLARTNSLVLIDELGRGTSPQEGAGIAHAIAEGLIALKCFVFFTTHFDELTTTLSRQPSVINLHLSVQRTSIGGANLGFTFQYKIVDGTPHESSHYGLELARLADLPQDVLAEGKRVAKYLATLDARHDMDSESSKIAMKRRALLRLRTQLTQALDHSALPDKELLEYIGNFQVDIVKLFR